MNKRQILCSLIVFVSITTIGMVLISKNMATIQVKAHRFFGVQNNASLHTSTSAPPQNQTVSQSKTVVKTVETTNRPLQCKNCFITNFPNLTSLPEVCAGTGTTKPELLMLITTTLDGLDQRQAIRDTWASVTKNNSGRIRHLFLLGTDKEGRVSEKVREECLRYNDMVVWGFVDAYGNLTYKTLMGLHYMVDHCRDVKYFLKTDQDMYVYADRILELAKRNDHNLQSSLGGSCFQSGKPWRDPKTKYYASIRSYPQSTYPGFCSGTGYIGSFNVAEKIVTTSPNIPFFHLEDVYLALVLRHLNYRLTKYVGFAEGTGVCRGGGERAKKVMTIHEVSPDKIREFWAKKCGV